MTNSPEIIAVAENDAPELLDTETLDAATGGVQYGGTNTCEPVTPTPTPTVSFSYAKIENTYDKTVDSFDRIDGFTKS
ncbi:MAG: hypothetical protein AAFP68_12940 [Pseudomonadota bacterium]